DSVDLTRRPGGYVLTVDPMAVDLHRFNQLLTQARTADDQIAVGENSQPFPTHDSGGGGSGAAAAAPRWAGRGRQCQPSSYAISNRSPASKATAVADGFAGEVRSADACRPAAWPWGAAHGYRG